MSSPPLAYAIDFGTTNSLIAAANASQIWPPLSIDAQASDPTLLRSVLYFPEDSAQVSCGAEALRASATAGMGGRLIRSIKRFLAADSFSETRIGGRRYALEDLVAILLRHLRERADEVLGVRVSAAVIGRPARFSDDVTADALARQRLERAAQLAGFRRVALYEEPVAAALQCTGQRSSVELVAVADLGGGTSDFTVALLGEGNLEVLAVGGIGLAGDALDGAIMREHVAPHLGSRVTYRLPFGNNVLTFPGAMLEKLCSPADLSLLDRHEALELLATMRSFALGDRDRQRLDRLLCLVEDRLGYQIFEAIQNTKHELSRAESTRLRFGYPGIELDERLARSEFERTSAASLARILARLEETLAAAGVTYGDLDRVYLTGGTAQVPAVRACIAERVGPDKIQQSRTYHAVVEGLAERTRRLLRAEPSWSGKRLERR